MNADFEQLVHTRGHALLRFAEMLCGDPGRAEDLVQNALTKAYLRWRRVSRAERPEAYLKAMIVTNTWAGGVGCRTASCQHSPHPRRLRCRTV